jgi:HSP20 family protein
MQSRQLLPWNWFKKEDERAGGITKGGIAHAKHANLNMHPLVRIQQQVDRLFEDLLGQDAVALQKGMMLGNIGESTILRPSLDISENAEGYRIQVEVPGVEQKDLQVELDGDVLTISGEKSQIHEEKAENYHQVERSFGRFERVLCLPANVNKEHMDASFKNGVLTIALTKQELPQSDSRKRIEISAA